MEFQKTGVDRSFTKEIPLKIFDSRVIFSSDKIVVNVEVNKSENKKVLKKREKNEKTLWN